MLQHINNKFYKYFIFSLLNNCKSIYYDLKLNFNPKLKNCKFVNIL